MGRRSYSDEQLRDAVARSRTIADICRLVGLVPRGGNYENIRAAIAAAGIDASHISVYARGGRGGRIAIDDTRLTQLVPACRSFAEVARRLGLLPTPAVGRALKRAIIRLGLDTSHMPHRGWRRGTTGPRIPRQPLDSILVEGRLIQSNNVKWRLVREGIKEWCCERCGVTEWAGEATPLELDHINGDRLDNRLENLRLLCPNCHALTPTYRGRNIGVTARALSGDAEASDVPWPTRGRGGT